MTSLEVYSRHKNAFILAIILIGLVHDVRCVTYEISADPENVTVGKTLTITAKLTGPFEDAANTDLRIILTQPGNSEKHRIFQYRAVTGCTFLLEPYISTGTVVTCDPANSRYVIRFPSVTASHVGLYQLSAPREIPARSADANVAANVQLVVPPTTLVVDPVRREVVEGQATSFTCTVDNQATTPVTLDWKRIVNGERNNPSDTIVTALSAKVSRLSWRSVSRQHRGSYECDGRNEGGALISNTATLEVYYAAASVTLTPDRTTVFAGNVVVFTCSSTGGNPLPGLRIYDVTSGATLEESAQSSSDLIFQKSMTKSDHDSEYGCRTIVPIDGVSIPQKVSDNVTIIVQFPVNGILIVVSDPTSLDSLNVDVVDGKEITLQCKTTSGSRPQTELDWSDYDVIQDSTTTFIADTYGDRSVRNATFTVNRAMDGKTYTCSSTYHGKPSYNATITLNVFYAPDNVTLSAAPTKVNAGNDVTFTCEAQGGNPVPSLRVYNIKTPNVSLAELPQSVVAIPRPTTTLNVTKQMNKSDNGAEFACQTGTSVTTGVDMITSNTVTIEVEFPPDNIAINVPDTVTVPEGTNKVLTCTTTSSNPAANLEWTGVGVDQSPPTTTNLSFGITSSRNATISANRNLNGGTYTCTATHPVKNYIKSTTLNVTYVAESVSLTSDTPTTVIAGTEVTLNCTSQGGNPLPGMVIVDVDSGRILKELPRATAAAFFMEKDMKALDDGSKYRCRTKVNIEAMVNETKRSDITFSVLHAATSMTLTSSSTTVVSGTDVTLTCTSVGGNPIPGLVIYDVTSGTASKVEELLRSDSNSTLAYTRKMRDSDDGSKYQCESKVNVDVGTIPVTKSEILTFEVLYPATSVTLTTNAATVIAGATVTVTCESAGGNPEPGLVIYNVTSNSTLETLPQSSGTTLTYEKKLEKWDDGTELGCRTEATVNRVAVPVKESKVITLGVLHPATAVTLTTESTAVFANTPVTLTCKSVDGNPMPGLVIYNVTAGTTLKELAQNEWRSLTFQISMEKSDNGTQYRCKTKVDVDDYPVKESEILTFFVLHGATSVTLTTADTTVDEGSDVRLTCTSVGGNPIPGLVIYDGKNSSTVLEELPQSNGAQVTHQTNLKKSDNGAKFGCKTKVEVGTQTLPEQESNVIIFDVQFQPDGIETTRSVTLDEGQSHSLRCETTSNSNPETELTWIGPDLGRSDKSTSVGQNGGIKTIQEVIIVGDRARNGATYNCTAKYRSQQIYIDQTTVDVNFAPKSIAFYDTLNTPILENQTRKLKCRAGNSNPAGTIVWRKLLNGKNSNVWTTSPREITGDYQGTVLETEINIQAKRQDNGTQYWCELTYAYSNGSVVTRKPTSSNVLNVYYPANSVNISAANTTVEAGTNVTLTCTSVGGNPPPGLVIYNVTSSAILKQHQLVVSSSLGFTKRMEKEDNGAQLACKTKNVTVGSRLIAEQESEKLIFNVQFPPDGIKTPETVTVDEEQSTSIRCETSSSSNPETELTWTGPAVGSSVLTTQFVDFGVMVNQAVTITGHRNRSDATYTCTAKHLGRQISTSTTKVAVNFAPLSIAFYETPITPIIEHQTKVLKCRAGSSKPPGNITWYKSSNGQSSVIPSGSPTQVPGDFGGIVLETEVTIKPTRDDDGAKCWCEVDYAYTDGRLVKQNATEIELGVYYTAYVTLSVNRSEVNNDDSVTFTCQSQGGNPIPGLLIYNVTSGTTLQELDRLEKRSLLTYERPMKKSDNGIGFGCKTKVIVPEGTVPVAEAEQVTVSVLFAPDGVQAVKDSVTVDEGDQAVLQCVTTSSSNPVTQLQWSGDGVTLTTSSESPGNYNGKIALGSANVIGDRTRNGANYSCSATWGQQTFTATAKIDVNFPPRAIAFNDTPEAPVVEKESKLMKCRAETSKPPGTITWWKQRTGVAKQRLQTTTRASETPGDYGGTILETEVSIEVTRQDNGANCWCEVEYTYTNGTTVNRKSDPKTLDVYYPVDVSISTSKSPVLFGDDVTLSCDTTGGNPQTITAYSWSFNGTVITDQKKRTLTLGNVDYDQTGMYACNASNEAGTTTGMMELKVGLVGTTGGPNASLIGAGVGVSILLIVIIVLIVLILIYRTGQLGAHRRKRDEHADSFDGGREENPYAEASFVNGGPGAPPHLPKKGRFLKGKKGKLSTIREEFNPYETTYDLDGINSNGTTNATPLEDINPYGTTFGIAGPSEEEINPYGTTFGKAGPSEEEINPYGTTFGKPGPSEEEINPYGTTFGKTGPSEEDLNPYGTTFGKAGPSSSVAYAEVNHQDSQAQVPLYAEVDKTKKKPPAPLYAEVDRSKKNPPEPLYAAVDKSRKSKVVLPDVAVYAELNPDTKKSNRNGHAPVPDEATYVNLSDVTAEQPRTHEGVDGIIYTELIQGPPAPKKPFIRPDPTMYAEIDIRRSMPPQN